MPATRNFCLRVLNGYLDLREELDLFSRDLYFAASAQKPTENCKNLAQKAMEQYVRKYVIAWNEAYAKKAEEHAALLKNVMAAGTWKDFLDKLDEQPRPSEPKVYLQMKQKTEDAVEYFLAATRWLAYTPGQERPWLEDEVCTPLRQAFANKEVWKNQAFSPARNFTSVPPQATTQAPPWKLLAGDVATAWQGLCQGLHDNRDLPTQFTGTAEKAGAVKEVPWGSLAKACEVYLPGEALTGQLIGVEARSQELLSCQLNQILFDLQERIFEGSRHSVLPLGDESNRDSLETVPLDRFRKFLLEVKAARTALEPLEKGLKSDDLKRRREALYDQCQEWANFLALAGDAELGALGMTVYVDDPLLDPRGNEAIDEGAPEYYDVARLYLGLRPKGGDMSAKLSYMDFLTVKIEEAKRPSYEWAWPSGTGESEALYFQLVQGQPLEPGSHDKRLDTEQRTLGKLSPLSFPAYLLVHGKPGKSRKEWIVSHAFTIDVKKDGRPTRVKTGVKIVFYLDRALPEPIQPMKEPPRPRSPTVAG